MESKFNSRPVHGAQSTFKYLSAILTYFRSVTHHKAESSLQVDISDAAVSFEKPLHILLSGRGAQPADENTTSTHDLVTFN